MARTKQKYHLDFLEPEVREFFGCDDGECVRYMPRYTILEAESNEEAERLADISLLERSRSLDGKLYVSVRQRLTLVTETIVKKWPIDDVRGHVRDALIADGFIKPDAPSA